MDFPFEFKHLSSADALAEIEALSIAHERRAMQNFLRRAAGLGDEETWRSEVAARDTLEPIRTTLKEKVKAEADAKAAEGAGDIVPHVGGL